MLNEQFAYSVVPFDQKIPLEIRTHWFKRRFISIPLLVVLNFFKCCKVDLYDVVMLGDKEKLIHLKAQRSLFIVLEGDEDSVISKTYLYLRVSWVIAPLMTFSEEIFLARLMLVHRGKLLHLLLAVCLFIVCFLSFVVRFVA